MLEEWGGDVSHEPPFGNVCAANLSKDNADTGNDAWITQVYSELIFYVSCSDGGDAIH